MLKNIFSPKQQRVDFPNLISKPVPNCPMVINELGLLCENHRSIRIFMACELLVRTHDRIKLAHLAPNSVFSHVKGTFLAQFNKVMGPYES